MTNEERFRADIETTEQLARHIVDTSCRNNNCFWLPNSECVWFDNFSAKDFKEKFEVAVEKTVIWLEQEEENEIK